MTASYSGNVDFKAAFTSTTVRVGPAVPTTPTITNLPTGGTYGGGFTAVVSTDGDGTTSVTSNSTSVCTVGGLVVTYVGVGTCSLTAHVAAGTDYTGADGTAQTFSVRQATPTTPTISNLPTGGAYGGDFTAAIATTGDGATSVTSNSISICTVIGDLSVTYVGLGTCSLTAHVAAGTDYAGADGTPQTFTVGKATPTTPTITNLPTGGTYGGGFTAVVSTDGDGTTSVISKSTSVCTVRGLVVTYVRVGTCSLTAEVAAGVDYAGGTGTPQTFTVGKATPSRPTITNLPTGGTYGGGFTATVSTNSDGTTSVISNSPSVCTVSGLVVTYVGVGTCSLSAYVAAGVDYSAASGTPQTFTVAPGPPSPPTGITATPNSATDTISLTWSPPSSNGGNPIASYEVLRGTNPGQEDSTPIATVTGTTYTDTTVVLGTTYYYVIVAVTAAGASAPSAVVSAQVSLAGPTGRSFAATPGGGGWWIVHPDGGVFAYGTAGFYGSLPGLGVRVNDIVAVTGTPDGKGYWLVGADGGVFSFGDAAFYGSMGGEPLNRPIVGITATPDGKGYWLVASDGGVFSFGDAAFYGSTGAIRLNQPVVGMAPAPNGKGYWLVASDGGIFAFGSAGFYGSTGGIVLNQPVIGMASTSDGKGYWLVASDGGVFAFGDAPFEGSLGGTVQASPVLGLAPLTGGGYELIHTEGTASRFGG